MPSTWLPDPSHYPEQMTPLSATTWFEAVGRGLHEAMRELRGPFAGFEARTELGWAYEGELPIEWEHDPELLPRAARDLARRWNEELGPRCHAVTEELHTLRPEQPSPDEAVALLDRMWAQVLEQWTIHFLVVIPAQISVELLHDAYVEAFGDDDALAPYRLLDGLPNETTEADAELWSLAVRARELGVDDVIRELPPSSASERLAELRDGRRFVADLARYLDRFGGRSRWHEVSLAREVERPEMTFESIRLLLEAGRPPSLARAEDAERFERDALAKAPALAEVLEAAKFGYALKESHVYHVDYPGLLALREALLAFGRRLFAEGRLARPVDVWMLARDDLRSAIDEHWHADRITALVEERRSELAHGLREGPRPFLGDAPTDVDRHAALEKFYGRSGRTHSTGVLIGSGASPGVAEGPARVISSVDDFARVRPGDVLVATTTTPAWTPLFPSLAALVTETGGVLSHAAIVAREYGLPAVVGADGATRLFPDGARVHVDGTSGHVRILKNIGG
jgi:phosphohistidine swiveling domain-containing protein